MRHRYEAAQTPEAGALEIEAKRLPLQTALKNDLDRRVRQTDEATVLFSEFAQRLYEPSRLACLEFDAGPSRLKIVPHVDSDDSRLFDGVDARQVRRALEPAAEVTEREGTQYIATLNSDDLQNAEHLGFDASPHLLSVRINDRYDDGGLFGFRF